MRLGFYKWNGLQPDHAASPSALLRKCVSFPTWAAVAGRDMPQPSQALRDALDASHQRVVSDLFDAIDRDGSGVLSKAEVDDFFSGPAGKKPWSLNVLDANGDGQVTWAEWDEFFVRLARLGGDMVPDIIKQLEEIATSKIKEEERSLPLSSCVSRIQATSTRAASYLARAYSPTPSNLVPHSNVMDASELESTGYMALKRKMLQLTASHPELLGLETEISAAAGKVRAVVRASPCAFKVVFVSFLTELPPPPPPTPTPLRRSPSSSAFTTRRWRPLLTAAVAARRRTPRL